MDTNIVLAKQRGRAISTLTLAFSTDPIARWFWPESDDYLKAFPLFAAAFGGKAIEVECAHEVADYRGVALWVPPGAEPDEAAIGGIVGEMVAEHKRGPAFELMEHMGAHHPKEPHWYLPMIGVDPRSQGRGFGAQLMARALARCDAAKLPAYLESSNPKNLPFYERLGFRSLAILQVADCPVMVPMRREPR